MLYGSGETSRRLTGKCLCILSRAKASELFDPFQLGVAYPAGAEKLVHGFRRCISEHWGDREFVACKVDLKNAFNEVSRQLGPARIVCDSLPGTVSVGLLVLGTTSHIVAPNGHTWVRTRCPSGRSFGPSPVFSGSTKAGSGYCGGQGVFQSLIQ